MKKDTLIIIGNGFDIWQDLGTSYAEFQQYYLAHRDAIMRKLRIKKRVIRYEDGRSVRVSDVELIYGDPFDPRELADEFWGTFETSLADLDAERINLYFGKERRNIREMKKSIRDAGRILREAFCSWIASIVIEEKETGYRFGDNCLFINFNYTDTLRKRFQVKEEDEFHIHGEASDKASIVFGHSTHPQLPEEMLYRLGGRFRGLYFIEKVLYDTDKHVMDNIHLLCMFLAAHHAMAEEIRQVYVLGHSMSLPDIEYFAFLVDATRVHAPEEAGESTERGECDPMDELAMRMQYAISHGGYGLDDEEIESEQQRAVAKRFEQEQAERNRLMEREFFKLIGGKGRRGFAKESEPPKPAPRAEDAMWHVSYFKEQDRQWKEAALKELGCRNFRLYPTIDECLKGFANIGTSVNN